jgi:hypothetical protein
LQQQRTHYALDLARLVNVATLLADDGSGAPYEHLGEGKKDKKLEGSGYFQLPYAYWRERWHEKLSLPAKAMLLIALYPGNGFPLPYNKMPSWYGISESSGERGLNEQGCQKNRKRACELSLHLDTSEGVCTEIRKEGCRQWSSRPRII